MSSFASPFVLRLPRLLPVASPPVHVATHANRIPARRRSDDSIRRGAVAYRHSARRQHFRPLRAAPKNQSLGGRRDHPNLRRRHVCEPCNPDLQSLGCPSRLASRTADVVPSAARRPTTLQSIWSPAHLAPEPRQCRSVPRLVDSTVALRPALPTGRGRRMPRPAGGSLSVDRVAAEDEIDFAPIAQGSSRRRQAAQGRRSRRNKWIHRPVRRPGV